MSTSWGSLYRKKTTYCSQKAKRPGKDKGGTGKGESVVTGKLNDGAEKISQRERGARE